MSGVEVKRDLGQGAFGGAKRASLLVLRQEPQQAYATRARYTEKQNVEYPCGYRDRMILFFN